MGHFLWSPSLFFFFICHVLSFSFFFFFNDTATTEIYTLSLHDALPISASEVANACVNVQGAAAPLFGRDRYFARSEEHTSELQSRLHLVCRLLLEKKKERGRIELKMEEYTFRQSKYLRNPRGYLHDHRY